MKNLKQKNLAVMALLLWISNANAQYLKYDVTLSDKKVGEMSVEKTDSAGFTHYRMKSSTAINLVFTTKTSDLNMDVWFDKQGNMISSYYHNAKDDGTIITKTVWSGGKLSLDANGDKSVIGAPVKLATVLLYFAEPKNLQGVFSERAGKLFDLKKQSDGTYLAKLLGGTGKYTYVNNKLVRLEVSKGSLGSIVMKLVE